MPCVGNFPKKCSDFRALCGTDRTNNPVLVENSLIIPCRSGNSGRDGFAADCLRHHPVRLLPKVNTTWGKRGGFSATLRVPVGRRDADSARISALFEESLCWPVRGQQHRCREFEPSLLSPGISPRNGCWRRLRASSTRSLAPSRSRLRSPLKKLRSPRGLGSMLDLGTLD